MTGATQLNNPLHGITLEMILSQLVERYGWERLGIAIDIRCFKTEREPWAHRVKSLS